MWNNKHQRQQIPKGILYQSQPYIVTRYKTIDSKSKVATLQNLKITTSRNLFVASSEDNNLNSRNLPFKKDFGKWTYIFTPNKAAFSNLLFRLIAFYSCQWLPLIHLSTWQEFEPKTMFPKVIFLTTFC